MRLLCSVYEKRQKKETLKSSLLSVLVTGSMVIVGGMVIATTQGLATGGVVGSLLSAWMTRGTFKPIPQFIMELPTDKQKILFNNAIDIVGHRSCSSVEQLTMKVMGCTTLQDQLVDMLNNYFSKELSS